MVLLLLTSQPRREHERLGRFRPSELALALHDHLVPRVGGQALELVRLDVVLGVAAHPRRLLRLGLGRRRGRAGVGLLLPEGGHPEQDVVPRAVGAVLVHVVVGREGGGLGSSADLEEKSISTFYRWSCTYVRVRVTHFCILAAVGGAEFNCKASFP